MGILDKLRRNFVYVRGALRTLKRLKRLAKDPNLTVADHIERWATATPNAPAIYYEDRCLTFGELDKAACQYARWALAQGVGRGDVVALMMENRPEYIIAWLGLAKIGAVSALINFNLRSHALAHCLNVSRAAHVIIGAECAEGFATARPHLAGALTGWATGGACDGLENLDKALAQQITEPLPGDMRKGLTSSDTCFYVFTSGTTGLPKAARLTHLRVGNLMFGFSAATNATRSDRMYIVLPLYHTSGGVCAVGSTLTVGGSIIIANKFSVSHFWEECIKYKATMFQYIGELCRYLLNAPTNSLEAKHSIRLCVGNGLRPDIWVAFKNRFKLPKILEFYGATEGNIAMFNYDSKPGAVGRVPGFLKRTYHFAVLKFDVENERPVRNKKGLCIEADLGEAGEVVGEILNEPRLKFDGYANKLETEKKILHDVFCKGDVWFRSGDLMRQDAQGYFYFVDRIGDTFRWKGENVATSEVAEVVALFEEVKEANVYGVAVPNVEGRAGMAALVVGADLDLAAFHSFIKGELPNYALPVFLRLQKEITVTGTFKHQKMDLVKEGFDPSKVEEPLYFLHPEEDAYVAIDHALYDRICAGDFRF